MSKNIFSKLDLDAYLAEFKSLLSRDKELFLSGDSKINYEKLQELTRANYDSLGEIRNLDEVLMRLSKQGILHISEIYDFVKIIAYFIYLKKIDFGKYLNAWLEKIIFPEEILKITKYFDNKGEILASVDERFLNINEALKITKDEINQNLRKTIYSKNLAPYLVDSQIHYVNEQEAILVRGGFNHVLKGSVIARSTSGFFYVLPQSVQNIKMKQSELLDKKEELIYEYCKIISSTFSKNLAFLKFLNKSFDDFDALSARAFLAKKKDYNFVLADNSKDIILKEFAHPMLKNPKRISIEFNKKVLLITGVNAGGKSMLLKSILTATLLSKYLLPMSINPHGSKFGTFKEFDAIIEDPQSASNDISTFAGRMLHFSKLFGKKSLLIGVDEIELGTDFEEAASLYSVLIEKLMSNDVKMIITTHHKRLAMILSKSSDVELVAALYDEENSLPRYEFLKGSIGKSYAFETALRYNIAPNIVAQAKKVYGEEKENLNDLISKTLNLELELREEIKEYQAKNEQAQKLNESLQNQKEKLQKDFNLKIASYEKEYYKAINEAKKAVTLDDNKEKQRAINKANEIKKAIIKEELVKQNDTFQLGDFVKYGSMKGKITKLHKNQATVEVNGVELRVNLNLLKRSGNPPKLIDKRVNFSIKNPEKASLILDLHGLRAEEALARLDKFISNSLIVGFDEVIVKHGIGTGKLAYAVKEFLLNHPNVKSFDDAHPSEGGFGAKVVKL